MLWIVTSVHSWQPLGGGMVFQQEKAFTVWDLSNKIKWPSSNSSVSFLNQSYITLLSLVLWALFFTVNLSSICIRSTVKFHAAFALHLRPFHTVSLWTWRKLTRTFSVRYFAPDISTMGMGWSFQHAVGCEECRLRDRPCCMAGLPGLEVPDCCVRQGCSTSTCCGKAGLAPKDTSH